MGKRLPISRSLTLMSKVSTSVIIGICSRRHAVSSTCAPHSRSFDMILPGAAGGTGLYGLCMLTMPMFLLTLSLFHSVILWGNCCSRGVPTKAVPMTRSRLSHPHQGVSIINPFRLLDRHGTSRHPFVAVGRVGKVQSRWLFRLRRSCDSCFVSIKRSHSFASAVYDRHECDSMLYIRRLNPESPST
jgi:hypothetical protein